MASPRVHDHPCPWCGSKVLVTDVFIEPAGAPNPIRRVRVDCTKPGCNVGLEGFSEETRPR